MSQKNPPETNPDNLPGGVVPDRLAIPNPAAETSRSGLGLHKDTNTVEGLDDPDAEAKAPGRTTHGATNNP
jgi:hypothetical protein